MYPHKCGELPMDEVSNYLNFDGVGMKEFQGFETFFHF